MIISKAKKMKQKADFQAEVLTGILFKNKTGHVITLNCIWNSINGIQLIFSPILLLGKWYILYTLIA